MKHNTAEHHFLSNKSAFVSIISTINLLTHSQSFTVFQRKTVRKYGQSQKEQYVHSPTQSPPLLSSSSFSSCSSSCYSSCVSFRCRAVRLCSNQRQARQRGRISLRERRSLWTSTRSLNISRSSSSYTCILMTQKFTHDCDESGTVRS